MNNEQRTEIRSQRSEVRSQKSDLSPAPARVFGIAAPTHHGGHFIAGRVTARKASATAGAGERSITQRDERTGTISAYALAKATARETVLLEFLRLRNLGRPEADAAARSGRPLLTLQRWAARYTTEGFAGLVDRCWRSGRESVAERLRRECGDANWSLAVAAVKGLALDLDGSAGAAWRKFARCGGEIKTPHPKSKLVCTVTRFDCPEPIKDYFNSVGVGRRSKHSISTSLLDLVRPTPVLQNAHRGPRTFALKGMATPRKLDIVAGDVFTSDDTTPIWAWWVPWPKSPEYPFGCKMLQGQLLPVIDVAAQCPLAFAMIAREKSSYRAADIWALFGYVFDHYGLPRLGVQLERGSWEATLIKGAECAYARGDINQAVRVGGLRMLPSNPLPWHAERMNGVEFPKTLQTWTSYLPKSKSIEAFFHRSQKLEGTLYGSLGRDQMRRPFERAKKIYEACKRGSADPRLHFLSGEELAGRLTALLRDYCEERIEGEVFFGKPAEVWANGIAEHGPLLRLPDDRRHLYRRDWSLCKISRGWVKPSRTDETTGRNVSYFYSNPELFAERDGQQALVYFDREDFESPAQIHAPDGRYLGQAEYFHRKGMFLDGEMDGHELRRLYAGAVMTIYSRIAPNCPSRQLPAEIAARRAAVADTSPGMETRWQDGRGGVMRVELGRQSGNSQLSTLNSQLSSDSPDRASAIPLSNRETDGRLRSPAAPSRAPFDRDAAAKLIARREAEARDRGELIET